MFKNLKAHNDFQPFVDRLMQCEIHFEGEKCFNIFDKRSVQNHGIFRKAIWHSLSVVETSRVQNDEPRKVIKKAKRDRIMNKTTKL